MDTTARVAGSTPAYVIIDGEIGGVPIACDHDSNSNPEGIVMAGITMPVRQGESWKVTTIWNSVDAARKFVYWTPIAV
jgi:hypothetical protein